MGPMTERDWRRSLRGAVYRGDGVAVVALVRTGGMRDDALQLLGEGLLVAIIGRVEHAAELGADCVNALRAQDRWLWLDCEGARDGARDAYRDMERFIGTIADRDRTDRLEIAIEGKGAFRRFRDVLARWPDELERWYVFSEERQRGRARAWFARRRLLPSTAHRTRARAVRRSPGGRTERDPHPRTSVPVDRPSNDRSTRAGRIPATRPL
jgi:hypothetical protein